MTINKLVVRKEEGLFGGREMCGRDRLKSLAAYTQMRFENTLSGPTASHNIIYYLVLQQTSLTVSLTSSSRYNNQTTG
jgi:hypothetical protein